MITIRKNALVTLKYEPFEQKVNINMYRVWNFIAVYIQYAVKKSFHLPTPAPEY